jgi:hypothetical protein
MSDRCLQVRLPRTITGRLSLRRPVCCRYLTSVARGIRSIPPCSAGALSLACAGTRHEARGWHLHQGPAGDRGHSQRHPGKNLGAVSI